MDDITISQLTVRESKRKRQIVIRDVHVDLDASSIYVCGIDVSPRRGTLILPLLYRLMASYPETVHHDTLLKEFWNIDLEEDLDGFTTSISILRTSIARVRNLLDLSRHVRVCNVDKTGYRIEVW